MERVELGRSAGDAFASEDAVHDELAALFIGGELGAEADEVLAPEAISEPAEDSGGEVEDVIGSIGVLGGRAGSRRGGKRDAANRVEALVLGHLPVRASLWVRQYAARTADVIDGAVALVRLARGGASIERHTPVGVRADGVPPGYDRWIVRVEEVDQPALLRLGKRVDRVTILTGADDAAVIAAYRLLKGLAAEYDGTIGEGEGPELAIAVAGAEPGRARAAERRLVDAAQRFLGRELLVGRAVMKAGPTNVTGMGQWEGASGVDELLERIRSGEVLEERVNGKPGPAKTLRPGPQPGPQPVVMTRPAAEVVPSATASRIGGVASRTAERRDLLDDELPPPLASLVRGLRATDLRCPSAPEVELATDEDGGLHVLTRFGREGLDAAVTAAGWARVNAMLLARCVEGLSEAAARVATVHVGGDDARELRSLADSSVQLHLVRRVEARGGGVWVCDPLN
jgi:hypothetical protein